MKKILVAVDFSDLATLVLNQASIQARAFESEILILHVEAPVPSFIGNEIGPPVISEHMTEEIERIKSDLDAMVRFFTDQGINSSYEFDQGPVIDTIVEKANEFGAEMIIMGAHNHGFLYRAFIGSTSSGVIKASSCPVLIIPEK
ncbi:MAG: universal stress protein [Bacteroidetes bacterium]|nr:universal stress protein [Bacteroidota bacterium]